MLQAVGKLITSRRNFLIRASAITAAGATVAVPVVALASPEERIQHHFDALQRAFADHYGSVDFARWNKKYRIAIVSGPAGALGPDEIDEMAKRDWFGR